MPDGDAGVARVKSILVPLIYWRFARASTIYSNQIRQCAIVEITSGVPDPIVSIRQPGYEKFAAVALYRHASDAIGLVCALPCAGIPRPSQVPGAKAMLAQIKDTVRGT